MSTRVRSWLILLLVGAVFASFLACVDPLAPNPSSSQRPASTARPRSTATATPSPAPTVPPAAPVGGEPAVLPGLSVSAVVRQVRPAVVQISNEKLVASGSSQAVPREAGVGSGVIYDARGYILTNHHVIVGAQRLTVALPDGRRVNGKLVGSDRETDLAVVKIEGQNLPVARLGRSSELEVGDWVIAIGNALGLKGGPTVTVGVVGALGRAVQEPASGGQPGPFLYDLIQTDAAINPGNSGGPLVNLQGEVVGINTLVAGVVEVGYQAQGIGFAIAIDTAKPIADELVATGRVIHPYIGIAHRWLSPALAAQLNIDEPYGELVVQVIAGSPAARAGLKTGDVIVSLDGTKLTEESALGRLVKSRKPGTTITLEILRNNRPLTVRLTLGEKPT